MALDTSDNKILFLSANAGTGHDMAAKVISGSISEMNEAVDCQIINSYELLNGSVRKVMEDGYLYFIRLLPGLYGYFYERKHRKKTISGIKDWLNRHESKNFKEFIDREDPDLIVCTHAFPCGVMAQLKKEYGLRAKVVGVLTDYVVNPFWIYPETDLYMVPCDDLKQELSGLGIGGERIRTTGIPVDPRFNGCGVTKAEARRMLNIDPDVPVLLIMGGGLGMSPVNRSLRFLKEIDIKTEAIIVMGRNEKDWEKMEKALMYFSNDKVSIRLKGYVDNIYEYMKAADLLVTKPGGVTTSEAMTAGLPMVVTSPLPGQEHMNMKYLTDRGVAVGVYQEQKLHRVINDLLGDRNVLNRMSERALDSVVPDSADQVAKHLFSCLS